MLRTREAEVPKFRQIVEGPLSCHTQRSLFAAVMSGGDGGCNGAVPTLKKAMQMKLNESISKCNFDRSALTALADLKAFISYRESQRHQESARDAESIDSRDADILPQPR